MRAPLDIERKAKKGEADGERHERAADPAGGEARKAGHYAVSVAGEWIAATCSRSALLVAASVLAWSKT